MYISKRKLDIHYFDTDAMGVIYHANYLKYFELGREQFLRDLGFQYIDLERAGFVVPVFDAQLSFKQAIRYGDTVYIKTWLETNGGVRTEYGYEIVNEEETIVYATGKTVHALVDKETFRPVVFKRVAPVWFAKYEEVKKK